MTRCPTLEELVVSQHDPDEETRRCAVMRIGHLYPLLGREVLVRALGDASWRVRKEAVAALLAGPADGELVSLLVQALGSEANAGLRNSALETLVGLGEPGIPPLIRVFATAGEDIRKFIVEVLGLVGGDMAHDALERGLEDPDSNVAVASAEGLARRGASESLPALVRAMERPDVWLRYAVLEAIAATGDPRGIPAVLSHAGDRNLRSAALDCLGSIGDHTALPFLLEGLDDPSTRLLLTAVRALVRTRDRLAPQERADLDESLRHRAHTGLPSRLAMVLESAGPEAEEIVTLLGIIGDPGTAGALIRAYRNDRLRSAVAGALSGWQGLAPLLAERFAGEDPEGRQLLLALAAELPGADMGPLRDMGLADSDASVRMVALTSAAERWDASSLRTVGALCHDPSEEVREAALGMLRSLAERYPDQVVPLARGLASGMDPSLRRGAARIFTNIGLADELVPLLHDDDAAVRSAALLGLGRLGRDDAGERLVLALTDEVPRVRAAAAEALGMLGGAPAPALLVALTDEDGSVVRAALRALSTGDEAVREALCTCISRSDGLTLIEALEALARLVPSQAPPILARQLDSPDEEIVVTALRLLGELGDVSWYRSHGMSVCQHPSWEVRGQAVLLMGEMPMLREELAAMLDHEQDPLVRNRISSILERKD